MSEARFAIVSPGAERDRFLPLLYLADDSISEVRSYYQSGDLYAYESEAGAPLAIVLAIADAEGSVELKAVAVDELMHGQGIGKRIVLAVLSDLRSKGARHVRVGTGNSGIGQLAFYQKVGFRLRSIDRDFFSVARGYPPDLEENGIPLRDMVWMELEL